MKKVFILLAMTTLCTTMAFVEIKDARSQTESTHLSVAEIRARRKKIATARKKGKEPAWLKSHKELNAAKKKAAKAK